MPTATINGLEIHYRERGEGFPVVLVHGFTGNSRNWALTVPVLTRTFRTISVDLRGHAAGAGGPVRADVPGLLSWPVRIPRAPAFEKSRAICRSSH